MTSRKGTRGEVFPGLPRQNQEINYSILQAGFSSNRFNFLPLSYGLSGSSCGNSFKESKIILCAGSYDCWAKTESLNVTAGDFFPGDAMAYCKHSTGAVPMCISLLRPLIHAFLLEEGAAGEAAVVVGGRLRSVTATWIVNLDLSVAESGTCEADEDWLN